MATPRSIKFVPLPMYMWYQKCFRNCYKLEKSTTYEQKKDNTKMSTNIQPAVAEFFKSHTYTRLDMK